MKHQEALHQALTIIGSRRVSALDFRRSYNDCWAFAAEYENAVRDGKGKMKELDLTFRSFTDFLRQIKAKGLKDFQALADHLEVDLITKPKEFRDGDVAFHRPFAVSVADGRHWICPQEHSVLFTKKPIVLYDPELVLIFRERS